MEKLEKVIMALAVIPMIVFYCFGYLFMLLGRALLYLAKVVSLPFAVVGNLFIILASKILPIRVQ